MRECEFRVCGWLDVEFASDWAGFGGAEASV